MPVLLNTTIEILIQRALGKCFGKEQQGTYRQIEY